MQSLWKSTSMKTSTCTSSDVPFLNSHAKNMQHHGAPWPTLHPVRINGGAAATGRGRGWYSYPKAKIWPKTGWGVNVCNPPLKILSTIRIPVLQLRRTQTHQELLPRRQLGCGKAFWTCLLAAAAAESAAGRPNLDKPCRQRGVWWEAVTWNQGSWTNTAKWFIGNNVYYNETFIFISRPRREEGREGRKKEKGGKKEQGNSAW